MKIDLMKCEYCGAIIPSESKTCPGYVMLI